MKSEVKFHVGEISVPGMNATIKDIHIEVKEDITLAEGQAIVKLIKNLPEGIMDFLSKCMPIVELADITEEPLPENATPDDKAKRIGRIKDIFKKWTGKKNITEEELMNNIKKEVEVNG